MTKLLAVFFLLSGLSGCASSTTITPITPTSIPPQSTETPVSPIPTYTPKATTTPIPSQTLRRGINLGNMLEAPAKGEWGLIVQEEYLDLIKEVGFDFVRLLVRWFEHTKIQVMTMEILVTKLLRNFSLVWMRSLDGHLKEI